MAAVTAAVAAAGWGEGGGGVFFWHAVVDCCGRRNYAALADFRESAFSFIFSREIDEITLYGLVIAGYIEFSPF